MPKTPKTNDTKKESVGERVLRGLNEIFYEHWDFGSNALVGWTVSDSGISIIVVPMLKVFDSADSHRRIFQGDRLMDRETFEDVLKALGTRPLEIVLEGDLGDADEIINQRDIGSVFKRYAVTKTGQRAAFLLDIAGFGLCSPEEQAGKLSILGYSLNIAAEKAAEQNIDIDLARSNTGDGFYVWNRRSGFNADVNLFCVLMIALAHQALEHRRVTKAYAPTIRTCFGIGSHYSYYQLNRLDPIGSDYIVGNLTIELARLIDHAGPNQILVADFGRADEGGGAEVSTERFLERAGRVLDGMADLELSDTAVTGISTYLTGGAEADGSYDVRKLRFLDKHGLPHVAYNAKVNIFLKEDDPIYLGLQDSEVAGQAKE